MSEFQDWCHKPEVVLTGHGWGVRISGCDVFDPINQHGVKSFRAFDVVKGLPTKEEASSFLANWLKEQLPDYDVLAAENERLRQELADPHRLARHSKRLVEELRARVAELERDAARWISVEDRLPECDMRDGSIGIEVLVYPPVERGEQTAFYGRRVSTEPGFYKYGAEIGNITHWMPLPAAPALAQPSKETQQ